MIFFFNPRNEEDKDALVKIATRLNNTMADPIGPAKLEQVAAVGYCAEGCFAPLCAALGGFVAQEVLKSLTGKFTPLRQWVSCFFRGGGGGGGRQVSKN